MSNVIIFDTETTGLPQTSSMWSYYPPEMIEKYETSRIVEIAWIKQTATGEVLKRGHHIIKPEGKYTTEDTIKWHKISTEQAEREGVQRRIVFDELANDCEDVDTLVGHNIDFDYHILQSELLRERYPNFLDSKKKVCTMKELGPKRMKQRGWPKLTALYAFLFKKEMENPHSAMADTNATAECYNELMKV